MAHPQAARSNGLSDWLPPFVPPFPELLRSAESEVASGARPETYDPARARSNYTSHDAAKQFLRTLYPPHEALFGSERIERHVEAFLAERLRPSLSEAKTARQVHVAWHALNKLSLYGRAYRHYLDKDELVHGALPRSRLGTLVREHMQPHFWYPKLEEGCRQIERLIHDHEWKLRDHITARRTRAAGEFWENALRVRSCPNKQHAGHEADRFDLFPNEAKLFPPYLLPRCPYCEREPAQEACLLRIQTGDGPAASWCGGPWDFPTFQSDYLQCVHYSFIDRWDAVAPFRGHSHGVSTPRAVVAARAPVDGRPGKTVVNTLSARLDALVTQAVTTPGQDAEKPWREVGSVVYQTLESVAWGEREDDMTRFLEQRVPLLVVRKFEVPDGLRLPDLHTPCLPRDLHGTWAFDTRDRLLIQAFMLGVYDELVSSPLSIYAPYYRLLARKQVALLAERKKSYAPGPPTAKLLRPEDVREMIRREGKEWIDAEVRSVIDKEILPLLKRGADPALVARALVAKYFPKPEAAPSRVLTQQDIHRM